MRLAAGCAVVVAFHAAHADPGPSPPPRIGVLAGIGVREVWLRNTHELPYGRAANVYETHFAPTVVVGYRLNNRLLVGVRGSGARGTEGAYDEDANNWSYHDKWSMFSLDLGVAAQITAAPVTVSPWIGAHLTRADVRTDDCGRVGTSFPCTKSHDVGWSTDFASFGVTVSFELPIPNVPSAVYVELQTGLGSAVVEPSGIEYAEDIRYRYTAVTFGLAFRR
jgi:hypothetical protein